MPQRVERWLLAAVVVLLHLLLWWAWSRSPVLQRGAWLAATSQAPLSVRLLPPDPSPPEDKPLPSANTAARAVAPRTATTAGPSGPRPFAITAAPTESVTAPPPAAAASQPSALDLTLPSAVASPRSPSLRDQWLNDPRSNTPRPTARAHAPVQTNLQRQRQRSRRGRWTTSDPRCRISRRHRVLLLVAVVGRRWSRCFEKSAFING